MVDVFKDKKIYAISDSDLDGIGARILGEYYVSPISNGYVPYNEGDRQLPDFDMEVAKSADIVIFTDITPIDMEHYKEISKHTPIYIFDHHQTARDEFGDLENYYFDMDRCGTKIFFDFLTEGKRVNSVVKEFVTLIDTYDRWVQESDLWKIAKGLHNSMYGAVNWRAHKYQTDTERYNGFISNQLRKFDEFDEFKFLQSELKSIERAIKKEETAYKEAKRSLSVRKDSEGNQFAYFECTSKMSLVASRLLSENPDIKYFIGRSTWDPANTKVSLRSQDGFIINHIAEKWGGGGHPNAAGVELGAENLGKLKAGKISLY